MVGDFICAMNCIGMDSMMNWCNRLVNNMMNRCSMYNRSHLMVDNWSYFVMKHWSHFMMYSWSMVSYSMYSMMEWSCNTVNSMYTMSSMDSNWSGDHLMNKMTG